MFKFFKKQYSDEETQLFNFLNKNRLFQKLTYDELAHFTPNLYLRTYQENEVVFFTGDPSQAVYIVKSGIVSLQLDLKDSFEKLMTLRSGKLFGDNAIINGTKRIYTAVVQTQDSELFVLPKANILEVLNDHPAICAKVMTAFSEEYSSYTASLFKTYKSSLGFFDLHTVYADLKS